MKFVINPMIIILILFHGMCHAETVLRFKAQITTGAHRLGDLLLIKEDKEKWSDLPLSSHPTSGEWVTKDKILDWMSQRLGKFTASWQGKTRVRVSHSTLTSGQALQDKAKARIISKLHSQYQRLEIEPLSKVKSSTIPLDNFTAKTSLSFPVAKRVCVWLNNGKQHIPIWFRVRAYAHVWVANDNMSYNTPIIKTAFSWKERNIAGLISPPAQWLPDNAWLKSTIEADKILLSNQIREAPVIIHGQTIKVYFQSNKIRLVMDAIALADGNMGQMIRVKNIRNQKSFDAKVIGIQQAEVLA